MMKKIRTILGIDVMRDSLKRDLFFEAQSEDCKMVAATSDLERPRTTRQSEEDPSKRTRSCISSYTLWTKSKIIPFVNSSSLPVGTCVAGVQNLLRIACINKIGKGLRSSFQNQSHPTCTFVEVSLAHSFGLGNQPTPEPSSSFAPRNPTNINSCRSSWQP
jgi:hypothetical protein